MILLILRLLVVIVSVYVILQFFPIPKLRLGGGPPHWEKVGSSYLDRHYLAGIGILLVISVLSVSSLVLLPTLDSPPLVRLVLVIVLGMIALGSLTIALLRLVAFPDTRNRSSHSLLANLTNFTVPHDKFSVHTVDGITIRGVHIKNGHRKVIILCHAGFRSKNSMADVALCEWLSERFDVISFDFRGHGESDGSYTGDGKTVLDLKAAIDYARAQETYEKIGVVGRSLGAWTILLEVARHHNVDSIVAAASPLRYIRDCPPLTKPYPFFVGTLLGAAIVRMTRAFRVSGHEDLEYPYQVVDQISPIPLLMVYCREDPFLFPRGTTEDNVRRFFEKAKEPKKLVFLEGEGHIYELPFIHRYYEIVRDWFEQTL